MGDAATGVFYGLKLEGYWFAMQAAAIACNETWGRYDYDPKTDAEAAGTEEAEVRL